MNINKFFNKTQNILFLISFLWIFSYFLSIYIPAPLYSPGGDINDNAVFIFVVLLSIITIILYYMSLKLLKYDIKIE